MELDEIERALVNGFSTVRPGPNAAVCAAVALDVALRKDDRMDPLRDALKDIDVAIAAGVTPATTLDVSGTVADLRGAPGLVFLPEIVERVVELAESAGIGVLGLRNSGGIHQLEGYTRSIAERGSIGIFFWNGGSYTVVPSGGKEPRLGTNPISYAVPLAPGKALVADFATSQIAFLELMHALKNGQDLPFGAGLNEAGEATTVATEVYDVDADGPVRLLPMGGGVKGFLIMLLVEILTGALVGAKMGLAGTDDPFTPSEFGGLIIALSIEHFGTGQTFAADVERLLQDLRETPAAAASAGVQLPGDGGESRASERRAAGVFEPSATARSLLQQWLED